MHLKMHEGNYSRVYFVWNKNGKTYSKFEKWKPQIFPMFSCIVWVKFNSFPYLSREESSMIFLIDFKIHGDGHHGKSVKPNIN